MRTVEQITIEKQSPAPAHHADPLAAGWMVLRRSSYSFGWNDINLELRSSECAEHSEIGLHLNHLVLWEAAAEGEIIGPRGMYVPYRKLPGNINTLVPGALPALRKSTPHRGIFVTVQPKFLQSLEGEMDVRPAGTMRDNHGLADPALRDLIRLLMHEVESGAAHGRLYADSLKTAIAMRLILLDRTTPTKPARTGALPGPLLKRIVAYMEAELSGDPDVLSLAAETGYSRSQFLKMFSAATGVPPHRYLMNMRLEKARALLATNALPLIEVAAVCGFSSQSHLTTAFRRQYGSSPARFARYLHETTR